MPSTDVYYPPDTKYNIHSVSDTISQTKDNMHLFNDPINKQLAYLINGLESVRRTHSGWRVKRPEIFVPTMIANMLYNRKPYAYRNHSRKHNICSNNLNHQYPMTLKRYQTIETLSSSDTHTTISLIEIITISM